MEMAYRDLLANEMGYLGLFLDGVSKRLLKKPSPNGTHCSLRNINGLHVRIDCQAMGDLINFTSGLSKWISCMGGR